MDFEQVLRRPIETARLIGLVLFARFHLFHERSYRALGVGTFLAEDTVWKDDRTKEKPGLSSLCLQLLAALQTMRKIIAPGYL